MLKEKNIEVFWGTQHCLPKRNRYTKNIKYLLTIHDLSIEKFKNISSLYNTIIQKIVAKKSCKNADKIIADSISTKQDIIDIFKINNEKIEVVYPGSPERNIYDLTVKEEETIRNKYSLEQDTKYIFFLSSIDPRKNLDTIVKAFENYKRNSNDKLKFIIAGRVGSRYKNTLKLINNSEFSKDIIMTGYITEKEKKFFFHYCSAFVYVSIYEGFGLPVLEAMQNGAIVITSNVSSLPEIGGDVAIYLNNILDEVELSNIIKNTLKISDDEKNRIVERGYEQAQKFAWKQTAEEIHGLMERII